MIAELESSTHSALSVAPPVSKISSEHSLKKIQSPAKSKTDSKVELAAISIAAAAESAAEYQRSMVSVTIDNDTHETGTWVTVKAPSRRRLLADMSSALTGLGLLVIEASIETSGSDKDGPSGTAVVRFLLGEPDLSKVLDEHRIESIDQRLQQRFCGEQGINGGVKRLVVERFIRAVPPWEHVAVEAAEGRPDERALWLKMVRATFSQTQAVEPIEPVVSALAQDGEGHPPTSQGCIPSPSPAEPSVPSLPGILPPAIPSHDSKWLQCLTALP